MVILYYATMIKSKHGGATLINVTASALRPFLPMAFNAIVELRIPDLLGRTEGRVNLVLATEINAQLPKRSTRRPKSFRNLQGPILMVQEDVRSKFFNDRKQPQRRFTETSERSVRSADEHVAGSNAAARLGSPTSSDGTHGRDCNPLTAEQGIMSSYNDAQKHSNLRGDFKDARIGLRKMDAREVVDKLHQSGALEGVKTLVDVGGGRDGAVVAQIVARNQQIRGINFDLPYVIAKTPKVKGVMHVAGDYFESIPTGDTMFLKHIIHNYGNEDAIQILQNCFVALPTNGKIILAECTLHGAQMDSFKGRYVDTMEPMMLGCFSESRERTAEEYLKLLAAARFSRFKVIKSAEEVDFIQGFKE